MHSERADIAVLGAGPAGAAAALGLAALGYVVAVVAAPTPRARPQCESFSARVVAALRGLGVDAALAAVAPPGTRLVRWAGAERELPGEALVERAAFDAGLRLDLAQRGVRVIRDEVLRVDARASGVRVALASGPALEARFALEARGRAAPSGGLRERGPETLCLVQRWRRAARDAARASAPRIAIASLTEGWAWIADDGSGGLTVQLALDASAAPPRAALGERIETVLADALCREILAGAAPEAAPFARAATPVLDGALAAPRTLRVGDAALAVDPLSGNGVFQALSTALVAPAVVNTLLRRPDHEALARSFYVERARELFLRFARVSRDFYALGAAQHGGTFWRTRATWPDAEPAQASGAGAGRDATSALRIETRPVVRDGWIEPREVVVTPERPLGTWHVAGAPLAPLVRELARAPGASDAECDAQEARALLSLPEPARAPVHAWLRAHRDALRASSTALAQPSPR